MATLNKQQKALKVWNRNKDHSRANILPKLMKQCELSEPGASTYYQNLKHGRIS